MFLLAKLISRNLLDQTSQDSLDEELEPNVFPKEINQAYVLITFVYMQLTLWRQIFKNYKTNLQ